MEGKIRIGGHESAERVERVETEIESPPAETPEAWKGGKRILHGMGTPMDTLCIWDHNPR